MTAVLFILFWGGGGVNPIRGDEPAVTVFTRDQSVSHQEGEVDSGSSSSW